MSDASRTTEPEDWLTEVPMSNMRGRVGRSRPGKIPSRQINFSNFIFNGLSFETIINRFGEEGRELFSPKCAFR